MDEHWNYTLELKIAYCMNTKVELLHDACAQRLTQWRDTIKSIVAEYIGFFVLFALSVTTTPFCHDSCRAFFWQKWMDVYLLHSHTFYWGYYCFLQDHRHCIRTFLVLTQKLKNTKILWTHSMPWGWTISQMDIAWSPMWRPSRILFQLIGTKQLQTETKLLWAADIKSHISFHMATLNLTVADIWKVLMAKKCQRW